MALVYSCCFWFSLRLGSVIIGIFSTIQGVICLIGSCLGYVYVDVLKRILTNWLDTMDLLYIASTLQMINKNGIEKYVTFSIYLSCAYIFICLLFTYGAITFNTYMMLLYIVCELVRLLVITGICITCLLIIKRNTVDIGILIAASVAVGFFLLGMFYLWECAANLPVLMYELERDEQTATIAKLTQMLETSQPRGFFDYEDDDYDRFNMFTISGKDNHGLKNNRLPYIG